MSEAFEQRHATLIREFHEYLFDHPEFAERIPAGVIVVLEALAPRRSRLVNPQLRMTS